MIKLSLGFFALFLVSLSPVLSEEKAKTPQASPDITVVVEYIEVNQETFSDHHLGTPLKKDAGQLRKEVQKWVKSEKAEIRETLIVRTRSGQRSKVEAVREIIYPTKYEFPPVPLVKREKDKNGKAKEVDMTLPLLPVIPPTPTAFETRNAGTSLEVDAVLSKDESTIDLNLAVEWVVLLPRREWENKMGDQEQKIETPTFHTSRIRTAVSLNNGSYAFLGTSRMAGEQHSENLVAPILLLFVRADSF